MRNSRTHSPNTYFKNWPKSVKFWTARKNSKPHSRIRIGFNKNPDTDLPFYLKADADPDPEFRKASQCGSGSSSNTAVTLKKNIYVKFTVNMPRKIKTIIVGHQLKFFVDFIAPGS
jgi:hypothetical protein